VRNQEDSSAQSKGQTPAQVKDDLSVEQGVIDTPLVEVEEEGMEMSNCNLKQLREASEPAGGRRAKDYYGYRK
jgi:hypothetical protein